MERVVAAFSYRDWVIVVTDHGRMFRYHIGDNYGGPSVMVMMEEVNLPLK